tara:strand:+ start:271 stop:927 length:657 start_codon:yes stop_codon:yes gene_type:complete
MNLRLTAVLVSILAVSAWADDSPEFAIYGDPIKKSYNTGISLTLPTGETFKGVFLQTGEKADSVDIICNMGQAIPDPEKEAWFINRPIDGLTFELRSVAVFDGIIEKNKAAGFASVVKNGDVLKTFMPIGYYKNSTKAPWKATWHGDVFTTWSTADADIEVFGGRLGDNGFAKLDLFSGNGFYYKQRSQDGPDYFLSGCTRSKVLSVPKYAQANKQAL